MQVAGTCRQYPSDSRPANMKLVVLCAAFLSCVLAAPPKDTVLKIPSFVKLCNRDQPNFDDCLKDAIQDIFPKLTRGIKELDLPPIDPLYVEEGLYEFNSGIVTGNTAIKDAYAYGLSDAQFQSVKTNFKDPNNMVIEAVFHLDNSRVEGLYKQQGRFMASVFNGRGNFNISTKDTTITWKLTGTLFAKNGAKYLKIKQFLITPKIGSMKVDASDLFQGNEALSKAMLSLVNQYWRATYDEMLPYTQEVWDKIFRTLANRVFLRVPFDDLFPTSQ